jgi:plastocyanin
MRRLLVLTLAAAGLLLPAAAPAADPVLIGTVGPGFTISLRTPAGAAVQHLDVGTYEIRISDNSDEHNFHLLGPGVDTATTVAETGSITWTLALKDGKYSFFCDPHSTAMTGEFTVGTGVAAGGSPPTGGGGGGTTTAPKAGAKLTGTVGPGFTISLKRGAAAVKKLAAGSYTVTVRDRSLDHDFHLSGPGVSKKTGVEFRGTVTWKVRLRKGTYRFVCDPHVAVMRGTFRVT